MKAESRRLLDKAARAIRSAETLLREDDANFAAGRAERMDRKLSPAGQGCPADPVLGWMRHRDPEAAL
jgi:hypothetical protein